MKDVVLTVLLCISYILFSEVIGIFIAQLIGNCLSGWVICISLHVNCTQNLTA